MNMIENVTGLGMSFAEYKKIYEANDSFCNDLNKNHPSHKENETFISFLEKGSSLLIKEDLELVKSLLF